MTFAEYWNQRFFLCSTWKQKNEENRNLHTWLTAWSEENKLKNELAEARARVERPEMTLKETFADSEIEKLNKINELEAEVNRLTFELDKSRESHVKNSYLFEESIRHDFKKREDALRAENERLRAFIGKMRPQWIRTWAEKEALEITGQEPPPPLSNENEGGKNG